MRSRSERTYGEQEIDALLRLLGPLCERQRSYSRVTAEVGVVGKLEAADAVGRQAVRLPDALHRGDAEAGRPGHGGSGPMGRFVRRLGAGQATTLSMTSWPSGGTRDGRVLSRSRPSTLSCAKRSCQRQTQALDFPVDA
jgi:hypothetical protein